MNWLQCFTGAGEAKDENLETPQNGSCIAGDENQEPAMKFVAQTERYGAMMIFGVLPSFDSMVCRGFWLIKSRKSMAKVP